MREQQQLLRIKLLKTLLELEEQILSDTNHQVHDISNTTDRTSKMPSIKQNNQAHLKEVLSVVELAEYLGVSSDCIYTMVREKQIPFVRVRKRIVFRKESIDTWLGSNAF